MRKINFFATACRKTCFLDKSAQRNNEKVFARLFQKAVVSKGEALVAVRRLRNLLTFKDQEGSQNNSVNCFGVGNPIKGFPEKRSILRNLTTVVCFFDRLTRKIYFFANFSLYVYSLVSV